VNTDACTLHILHAPGNSDLGLPTGDTLPLEATLSTWFENANHPVDSIHLMLVSTPHVIDIARVIELALQAEPALYGKPIDRVTVVACGSLTEQEVAAAVRLSIFTTVNVDSDRVLVVWGSGATQSVLGSIDAVLDAAVPWSLAAITALGESRHAVYDPTADLPVDPIVPLLRHWRYHALVADLVERGLVDVTEVQRRILTAEADRWGHAYSEPDATKVRAVLAAALLRADGTSGFTALAYAEQHYRELRQRDGSTDLLEWAQRGSLKPMTFGRCLKKIRMERGAEAQRSESGRWLMSPVVDQLTGLGNASRHELLALPPRRLSAVRGHLRAVQATDQAAPMPGDSGLGELSLVPATEIWYVALLGKQPQHAQRPYAIEEIAKAAVDKNRCDRLDPEVRWYVGAEDGRPVDIRMLVLGTRSCTYEAAVDVANRLGGHASSAMVDDTESAFTEVVAERLLEERIGREAAAVVLVPSGPKRHVLALLVAAQRVTARRGLPLYLRQLVDGGRDVVRAGIHRLPLRFGTDLGVLTAAGYALDIAEFDTAARLLVALGHEQVRRDLALPVRALSYAQRCEVTNAWPEGLGSGLSLRQLSVGLLPDRIEVYASLPGLTDGGVEPGSRAIIGACAAVEASTRVLDGAARTHDSDEWRAVRRHLHALFDVRNELPIMHGSPLAPGQTLNNLVSGLTKYSTIEDLLTDAVRLSRVRYGADRPSGAPELARLRDDLRRKVGALCQAERARRQG
jgi:hypothetical protein